MEPANETKDTKTILLVEDNQTIRELYATALINAGLEVILAADGAEGVRLALEKKPAVVLFDIEMPVLDGHKAAEKIRLDSWGKNVPIIFLTNHSDAANVAHAHMLQPDDYIVKANIPIKEVVNRVRLAMHR
jgi:two-component system OmpR family response regulator